MDDVNSFRFLSNKNTMDIKACDTLYQQDSTFCALVKNLENIILELNLSPSEIRAAAMYAAYRVEMIRVRPFHRALD